LITYDFKHPSRVSREQTRTLENLHMNLARMMASAFSTFARQIVDVDIAFVDQTTYAEFIVSLSNPSVSYTFRIDPLGGHAVMDFSTPVAYAFIERQFGGTGGRRPGEQRPLTAIERTVMTSVVIRALSDLEATWEPLMKISVADAELETNPEFMQVAATQ
jgi:flagellar motor switch protein FliM